VAEPVRAAEGPARAERVAILTYHRVGSSPRFARQVKAMASAGYHAVTLERVWQAWYEGAAMPRRPVVLSFDDGYLSQYATAARTLRGRGWPGLLNLEVDRIGRAGGLSRAQVRRMVADGWEVGSHSLTHPHLSTVGPERLRREVAGSREALEREFGIDVEFFCFPYGEFDAAVKDAVRAAGYLGATTTRGALASPQGDPFELPRIAVGSRTSPRALLRRLRAAARRRPS
jgi:peptidoglycan/xylan/chitin deacetylase (PgdA/CDA1 family)